MKIYCTLVISSSKTDANCKQSFKYYASTQATCSFSLFYSIFLASSFTISHFPDLWTVAVIDWQVCSWCPVCRIVAGSPCQPVVSLMHTSSHLYMEIYGFIFTAHLSSRYCRISLPAHLHRVTQHAPIGICTILETAV